MTASPEADVIADRYVLDALIGRGAMAEVRSAEDLRLGRSVAVKLLHKNLAVQPEARLRFEEEARAAARLSDPNVVAIYDTGEHRGRPFIVMELLPGRTLHDELGDGPLSEDRACDVITHVLRALRAAHSAGVIHRDIKPANILLTATGEAKVADFGIAKVAESNDLTATGLVLGTPSYLAPECVNGRAATTASDLYAVGVVLYEALSGSRPFAGPTPLAVCHAIVSDEASPLRELCPRVSIDLINVVVRSMAKDPRARYRSADEMIGALEGESVPLLTSVDEETQPIDAEPTLVSVPTPTEVLAVPAAVDTDAAVSAAQPVRVARDPKRPRVMAVIVAIVAVLGGALFLAAANRDADPSTKPPAVTTSPVRPQPTVTAAPVTTAPVTEPTNPKKNGPGPGKGHGPGPEEGNGPGKPTTGGE